MLKKLLFLIVIPSAAFAQSNNSFSGKWTCEFSKASLYYCARGVCGPGFDEIDSMTIDWKRNSTTIDSAEHRFTYVQKDIKSNQRRLYVKRGSTVVFISAGLDGADKAISLISVGSGLEVAYHHGWTKCK